MLGPQTWGPYTLTPGVPQKISVGPEIAGVQIHNDTPYLLFLAYGDVAPTALDSLGGQYNLSIRPWDSPVIHTQRPAASLRERALNAIADWDGVFWLMPIAPVARVLTGNITLFNTLTVDAYTTQDELPQARAIARESAEVSQQRVIALPPTPLLATTRSFAPVAVPSDLILKSATLTSAQKAAQNALGYAFSFDVRVAAPTIINTLASMIWELHCDIVDGGGGVLTTNTLYQGIAYCGTGAAGSISPYPFTRSNPCPEATFMFGWGSTGVTWQWRFHVTGINGNPTAYVSYALEVDMNNPASSPGTYGNAFAIATPGTF